jgi:RHS repeat-associated protein
MAYDAASQMTGMNRYSDLSGTNSVATSSYTYDLAGRLTKMDYKHGSTAINSFNYAYDAANRLTQETSIDGTSNYNYDETDQLVNASHGNQANEAYTYDANGNRTNAGYGTGTNNQLLTDGKFNYQYDNEGNRTQKKEIATGEVTDYNWDERNRLTQITVKNAGGQVIKSIGYTYDVYNQRIAKVVDLDGEGSAPATTERLIYDDGQISLVFDGQGNQTHRYLYGENVDQILADETNAGVRWAVTDKQGTVTDVIDSQGQVLNHLVYDSFGKITSQSNPAVEFRYGYTGRELDTETGDYYYRAQYYDANVGRFIGEDPLGFGAGDGNLTRYVFNSPTNFIDQTGEFAIVATAVGVGALATAGVLLYIGTEKLRRDLANDLNRLDIGESIGKGINNVMDRTTQNHDSSQEPKTEPEEERKLPPDNNPNCEKERKKKCKTSILYRGDTREPVPNPVVRRGVFFDGFKGNGPNKNFDKYVLDNVPSVYVGTSKNEETGQFFATKYKESNYEGYVYAICDPLGGIDVNERYRNDSRFKYHKQEEVAFEKPIKARNIRSVYFIKRGGVPSPDIPNPQYDPTYEK